MTIAKCNRCGGTAHGATFLEASSKINHAVGLSRGIKCGANYNQVIEVKPPVPKKPIPKVEKPKEPIPNEPITTPNESPTQPKPTKPKPIK